MCSELRRRSRQTSDTHTVPPDRHDCAVCQVVGDGRQVGQRQRGLMGRPARGTVPKQDDRRLRLLSQHEERAEIRVGRDDHACLADGELENHLVFRFGQPAVTDMNGVVPSRAQVRGDIGESALSIRNFISSRARATLALEPLRQRSGALP